MIFIDGAIWSSLLMTSPFTHMVPNTPFEAVQKGTFEFEEEYKFSPNINTTQEMVCRPSLSRELNFRLSKYSL